MMWRALGLSAPAFLLVAMAGCQAPPLAFSPYGATQVAPPGTGSYGRTAPGVSQRPAGNEYYSRQAAAVAGAGAQNVAVAGPSAVGDWRAATSAGLVGQATASATGQGQVVPASAIAPIGSSSSSNSTGSSMATDAVAGKETVRIVEPTSTQLSSSAAPPPTSGGMPVNDGTRLREPRLFSLPPGVIAISQWPAAATGTGLTTGAPAAASGATAGGLAIDANNPARSMRGLTGSFPVAQVSAEAPVTPEPTAAPSTTPKQEPTPATTTASTATASSAPLGWRVKDGLK